MQNSEQRAFIELNRRFRKLKPKAKSEEAAVESYTTDFLWGESSLSWDALLEENRAVVLGEPGSGKSWEFRERAKLLANEGKFAFFVRLDQLVERDLHSLLTTDEKKNFLTWKKGNEVGRFFLDSVDEAKFHKVSDFHAALNRFRNELGSDLLLRTKIFLSSRISEWKPSTDSFEFQRLFPQQWMEKRTTENQSHKDNPKKPELLVVQIEPLNRDQVERLARANGVSNVEAFSKELDQAFAWEFARRPLDVSDLVAFWLEKGRIGSLTELIEFDISSKLSPRAGRDEYPLSETEGREGAEWLAAASLFSRRFSFYVPDDGSTDEDSLSPRACLPPNWRDDQMRALLNRAIFDSAAYGHLRFHHRRVGEYLAAKWLAARMDKGCPPRELEQIFVEVVRGRKVLRPSLRSIAAWLCCGNEQWNRLIRNLVTETDPGIHLKYGDPASLSLEYRRQVLSALSHFSKDRKRMWIDSSPDCLARLANADLATQIAELILDRTLAIDFRIELFDIVQHGRLSECLDAAIFVIGSPDEQEQLKTHAASAIGAINDAKANARLAEVVSELSVVPNGLCTSVVKVLYPNYISASQLAQLLAKTKAVPELTTGLPYYLSSHFESAIAPQQALVLLKELLLLVQTAPLIMHGENEIPVSEKFSWVGRLVFTVLLIVLKKPAISQDEVDVIAESLQILGYIREYDPSDHELSDNENVSELNKLTIQHPNIRRTYLWRIAAEFRKRRKKEPTMAIELFDHWEVLRLSAADFSWLIEESRTKADSNDRRLAFRLAIEIWNDSGRSRENLSCLRRAQKSDPTLRNEFQQSAVTSPLFPFRKFWWRNIRYNYGRWWWQQKADRVVKRWRWLREQFLLLRNLSRLKSGKPLGWLERLSREADKDNHGHWAPEKWTDLEKKRGQLITRAAKQGCKAAWRVFNPPLPHEKPEPNKTSIGVLVGLTGLQVEFQEDPNAIAKLTTEEAKLAARYAMDELNGFPSWLENLAAAHPDAVAQVLSECIEGEWKFSPERERTNEVFAHLAWQTETLICLVKEKVLSLLIAGDPANQSILRYAIALLMRQGNPPIEQLTRLAAERALSSSDLGPKVLWFGVWMQFEGETAVFCLEKFLSTASNPVEIVVRLCSILSGEEIERIPYSGNPNYLRPICLRHFIPLVYRYVRIQDDLDRSSGAYSPIDRDYAQKFRNVLLSRLENDEDLAATDVLRELADEPAMSQVRDWILNLLEKRLVNEADFVPWKSADVRDFAENHEVDPKNDKELFAIVRKRLQVLKWDVEKSDNSLRDELRKDDREMFLRRWLQRRLMERSQNRYNVPQEEEIDQQERPDLRVENPKINGPVSIEVKWADSWTLEVLLERLENQLVGQYLRAHTSQYGIYLLGFIGKKQHWEEPITGKLLNFTEVVELIRQKAVSLVRANPKIAGLEVLSIDFCQPN
jgi:hypothetical protein